MPDNTPDPLLDALPLTDLERKLERGAMLERQLAEMPTMLRGARAEVERALAAAELVRVRAEVERMRAEDSFAELKCKDPERAADVELQLERQRLLAKRERLIAERERLIAEHDRLVAELERARAEHERWSADLSAELERARAEAFFELIRSMRAGGGERLRKLGLDPDDLPPNDDIASRLRAELHKLRDGRKNCRAPVRRGEALAEIEIADLALKLLKHSLPPASWKSNVVRLLEELLRVDRHKAVFAATHEKFVRAICVEAEASAKGDKLGVRKIGKLVGVSPSTILEWQRSHGYNEVVSFVAKELVARRPIPPP